MRRIVLSSILLVQYNKFHQMQGLPLVNKCFHQHYFLLRTLTRYQTGLKQHQSKIEWTFTIIILRNGETGLHSYFCLIMTRWSVWRFPPIESIVTCQWIKWISQVGVCRYFLPCERLVLPGSTRPRHSANEWSSALNINMWRHTPWSCDEWWCKCVNDFIKTANTHMMDINIYKKITTALRRVASEWYLISSVGVSISTILLSFFSTLDISSFFFKILSSECDLLNCLYFQSFFFHITAFIHILVAKPLPYLLNEL